MRVLAHQPGIEILARVAHGVRSLRGAAVEIGILNRDAAWVKWALRDRDIWQSTPVPAFPLRRPTLEACSRSSCGRWLRPGTTRRSEPARKAG